MGSVQIVNERLALIQSRHLRVSSSLLSEKTKKFILTEAVKARHMICQMDDSPDDGIAVECASAIASSDNWRTLLGELIRYTTPTPRVIRVMSRILQARNVDHPARDLADHTALAACTVFDALWDGDILKAKVDFDFNSDLYREYTLIGFEDPLKVATRCHLHSSTASTLTLAICEPAGIVESGRSLISPCLLVCAGPLVSAES